MDFQPERLMETMERLVKISRTLPSNPDPSRSGGYFVAGRSPHEILFPMPIGTMPMDKESKYHCFAMEKALRVYADSQRDPKSVSSWQTRNPEANQYGGAILVHNAGVLSFSGLCEHVDEAAVLTLAELCGWISKERTSRIVEASQNPVFTEMWDAYEAYAESTRIR